MHYFIYETTNLINGRKYRGMHSAESLSDNYLGSGKLLNQAIRKYGKEKFERKILETCSTFEEMCEREKYYVNEEWISNKEVYNLRVGGIGNAKGSIPWNKNKKGSQIAWNKKLKLSKQTEGNLKRSNTLKEKYSKEDHHSKGTEPWNKGKNGTQTAWNKGKELKKIQCPHCNKQADIGNLRRWHLDNCKYKI